MKHLIGSLIIAAAAGLYFLSKEKPQITKEEEVRNSFEKMKKPNFINADPPKSVLPKEEKISPKETLELEDLGLSETIINNLSSAGIKTLEDLTKLTFDDLLKVDHLGKKKVNEIEMKLKDKGYHLAKSKKESKKKHPKKSNTNTK